MTGKVITVNIKLNDLKGFAFRLINNTITKVASDFLLTVANKTPKRTGTTAGRWHTKKVSKFQTNVVNDSNVVIYLDKGTGIYGARGSRIYPKRARALRWVDGGKVVFAKSTKGQKARNFIKPALKETVSRIPKQVNVGVAL